MNIRFTRSARRHRIGRARALHVMAATGPTVTTNARGETEYYWVGADDRGLELEIAAVLVDERTLLVLHVMPVRFRGERS